jgi:hypothetical protein
MEVVLAVTLALALVVAMFMFYKQVADIRANVASEVDLVAGERAVMDIATAELRAAAPRPPSGVGFQGGVDAVRFASTTLPGPGAWLVRSATDGRIGAGECGVQIIGYRLRVSEDADGQPVVEGVERTCQRLPTASTAEEGKEITVGLLAPGLKFLRLRYWDGTVWLESWGRGELPAAVEIVLGERPLPEGVEPLDYPYPTFRRVVALPGAAPAAPAGNIIRGLGEEGGA